MRYAIHRKGQALEWAFPKDLDAKLKNNAGFVFPVSDQMLETAFKEVLDDLKEKKARQERKELIKKIKTIDKMLEEGYDFDTPEMDCLTLDDFKDIL